MERTNLIIKTPGKQRGIAYILLFWLMLLTLVCTTFFAEGIALFSENPHALMNDAQFFITFALAVTMIVAFLVVARRNFRLRLHGVWATLFTLLFLFDVVAVFALQPHFSFIKEGVTYTYDFTWMQRIRYVLSFWVSCTMFYLYFAVFPRVFHSFGRVRFFAYLFFIVCVFGIIYSFCVEGHLYLSIFQREGYWASENVKSFTNHPNNFAFLVLLGIISCIVLHNQRSNQWWWWLCALLLSVFQIAVGSGSGIVSSWVLMTGYVVYRFFVLLKRRRRLAITVTSIYLGIVLTFALLALLEVPPGTFIARVGHFFHKHLDTLSNQPRYQTWGHILQCLDNPLRLLFGVGEGQCLILLGLVDENPAVFGTLSYAHNGFLHQLLAGGLYRLILYIGLWIRFGYVFIHAARRNSRYCWPCLLGMSAVFLRSLFETTAFLTFDTKGAAVYVLLILPVEVDHFREVHPEIGTYLEQAKADRMPIENSVAVDPLLATKTLLHVLTIVAGFALGILPIAGHFGRMNALNQPSAHVAMTLAFALLPILYFILQGQSKPQQNKSAHWIITTVFVICVIASYSLSFLVPWIGYVFSGVEALTFLMAWKLFGKEKRCFKPFFRHVFLPHAIFLVAFIGLMTLFRAFDPNMSSYYIPLFAFVLELSCYLLFLSLPWNTDLVRPLLNWYLALDCRHSAECLYAEEAILEAQDHYLRLDSKEGYREQNR